MEEKIAALLEVRAGHGLAPRMFGFKGRFPQYDVLAVERTVALANGHVRLARVIPDGGEAIRLGIEAGDSGAGTLRSITIEGGEIRLQELAVLDHVLLTRALCHDRFAGLWKETLNDVPVARELREQPLTSTHRVWRLILIVSLLRERRRGDEQNCRN